MIPSDPLPSPDGTPNSTSLESTLAPETVRATPFVFWSLAFASGILLDSFCLIDLRLSLSAALLFVAIASKRRETPKRGLAVFRAVILSCLPFAFIGAAANARLVRYIPPDHITRMETQSTQSLRCVVVEADRNPTLRERERDSQWRSLVVNVVEVDHRATRGLALLTLSSDGDSSVASDIQIGDRLRIDGAPLTELSAPPDDRIHDPRIWLLRRGIVRRIRASDDAIIDIEPTSDFSPFAFLKRLRNRLATDVADSMRTDDAALFNAFILGYKKDIDGNLYDLFRQTGTAHLLAISGLHLHLFAMLVWMIGRRFSLSRERLAVVVLAVSFAYGALTGFQPPVARAFIMLAVYLGGIIIRRDSSSINSVGLAALLLLIASPAQLFDAGFQLSFAAVGGIIVLAPSWQRLLWGRDRVWAPEVASIADRIRHGASLAWSVSFAAWVSTAPIIGVNFGAIAPFAPITNILVIPVSAVAQAVGIVWLAASLVLPSGAPEFLTAVAGLAVWLLRVWVDALGSIFVTRAAAPDMPALIALSAITCIIIAGRFARDHATRFRSPFLQSFAAAILLSPSFFPKATIPEMTVIRPDEKPTLIIIDSAAGATVIDPGTSRRASEVIDILRASGVRQIDALILTRPATRDPDGASVLIETFPVRQIILPPATKIDSAHRGRLLDALKARGLMFKILSETQPVADGVRRDEFNNESGLRGYRLAISTPVCDVRIRVRLIADPNDSELPAESEISAFPSRTTLQLDYARQRSSYRVMRFTVSDQYGERRLSSVRTKDETDGRIIRLPIR